MSLSDKYNLILDINSSILSLLGKRLNGSMEMLRFSLRDLERPFDVNKEETSNYICSVSDSEKSELLSLFGSILKLFLIQDGMCVNSAFQSLSSFYKLLSLYNPISFPQMSPSMKADLDNVMLLLGKMNNNSSEAINILNFISKKFEK